MNGAWQPMDWLRLLVALSLLVSGGRMLLRPRTFVGGGRLDAADPRTVKIFGWVTVMLGVALLGMILASASAAVGEGTMPLAIAVLLLAGGVLAFVFQDRLDGPESALSGKMAGACLLFFGLVSLCIFLVETF